MHLRCRFVKPAPWQAHLCDLVGWVAAAKVREGPRYTVLWRTIKGPRRSELFGRLFTVGLALLA